MIAEQHPPRVRDKIGERAADLDNPRTRSYLNSLSEGQTPRTLASALLPGLEEPMSAEQHPLYVHNKTGGRAAAPESEPAAGARPADARFRQPPSPVPTSEIRTSAARVPVPPLPTANDKENVTPMGIGLAVVGVPVTDATRDAPGTVGVSPAGVGVTGSAAKRG